jgi:hypothetical protein
MATAPTQVLLSDADRIIAECIIDEELDVFEMEGPIVVAELTPTAWIAYLPTKGSSNSYKYFRFDQKDDKIYNKISNELPAKKQNSIKPLTRGDGQFR